MWFFVLLVIAIIPAAIAKSKGKNFGLWYLYGVCLWIVALIHAIVLKEDESQTIRETLNGQTQKKCPYCAEFIKMEAKICRFCGKEQEVLNNDDTENSNIDIGEVKEGYEYVKINGKTLAKVKDSTIENYYCPFCFAQINPTSNSCSYCGKQYQ